MLIHSPKELAMQAQYQRKQQTLSQSSVAERVGLKQNTVSNFEIQPESTKLDTLFRILSALNLELHLIPKNQIIDHNKQGDEW
jgi:HTH-type transcriptional regulator/antitoxin HipB